MWSEDPISVLVRCRLRRCSLQVDLRGQLSYRKKGNDPMSSQPSPGHVAAENADVGSPARPYQPPHLTRVGSLRHLLGKSGNGDDAMVGMMDMATSGGM
jgi:hypothetical protein